MKRGLSFSLIALVVFIAASASADVRSLLDGGKGTVADAAPKRRGTHSGAGIRAGVYRSPGAFRKVIVAADDAQAIDLARSRGAVEVSDYGSFKLFVMTEAAVEADAEMGLDSPRRRASASARPFTVRDDLNVILLRSGAIDTTAEDAPGSFVGLGRATGSVVAQSAGAAKAAATVESKKQSGGLRLIQFIGPVKSEWLDELRESGLEPVAYIPNNAYIVRGSQAAASGLIRRASRGEAFVQWEGEFAREYKIHPALVDAMEEQPGTEVTVAVQLAAGRDAKDVMAARKMASSLIGDAYAVATFTNVRMTVSAARINDLAALTDVINVEPWTPPQLSDERSSQIIAADLTADGKTARGPGYIQWLDAHGFGSRFSFAIDVSDSGIDRGFTSADKLHPDFLDSNKQSRVLYARDYTSELDAGDVPGHGTINLSIAGGANVSSEKNMRDSSGYNYGLGVAPFAQLGSSKIFQSSGRFDLIEPYTKLVSDAYLGGARVSSNSWSAITNSYTIDSQEYDIRVRDAVPSQAGNQEMLICFAAGNAGFVGAIGAPSTAKNVISVGASENSRKDGTDGCNVDDSEADSALDMASFSSAGPLNDGRCKPDIAAPGTHIQGAASQHPDFDGTGICGQSIEVPYFPKDQTLYTWSSGTSHSTPQVAGAAALARQFFLNRGQEPSAALVKALLLNTTTYMTGELAGGDLPHAFQGWGLLNMNRAFDGASKIFVNQTHVFNASGQEFVVTGEVKDSTQPVRVTLAWTDAPGFSGAAPWVNDLDLEVAINGQVYGGNNYSGQQSQAGGDPDTKNNVESVWLPAGTVGTFAVRVRAANIAGDALPGNSQFTDQDFALVIYNGERKDAPVAAVTNVAIAGGADSFADPGEAVSMKVSIGDLSPVALTGGHGTLTSNTSGVAVTAGGADFPNVAAGQSVEALQPFSFTIDRSVQCGSVIQFQLDVVTNGLLSRVPFAVRVGNAQPLEVFGDDVESGESKWTHGSAVKKKKNRIDTWTVSTRRFRSGGNSWFTPDPPKMVDAHLDSLPVQLPADARDLKLVFYHTFEFEQGRYGGGVLEISTGGDFEDLGPKILRGRYSGEIGTFARTNPMAGRSAWVEGRLGQFQQVVVDLSSYAGKTVVIRFRIGTDQDGKGLGWYVDDLSLRGDRVTCSTVSLSQ